MPLVTESGGDLDYLAAMAGAAGISAGDVGDALVQLVSRNLVDSRGDLYERRYTIHSLTRAFLQQEILRWPAPDSGMVA
jgi:DNA-binding MarR family transcriptional regulator